jgi:hypothetical protein
MNHIVRKHKWKKTSSTTSTFSYFGKPKQPLEEQHYPSNAMNLDNSHFRHNRNPSYQHSRLQGCGDIVSASPPLCKPLTVALISLLLHSPHFPLLPLHDTLRVCIPLKDYTIAAARHTQGLHPTRRLHCCRCCKVRALYYELNNLEL